MIAELPVLAEEFNNRLLGCQDADSFLDVNQFEWIKDVEALADEMTLETRALLDTLSRVPAFGDIQEQQRPLSGTGWRVFPFLVYGHRIEWSLERFPATREAISRIPGCITAMFSIMQPGQHLVPHTGPSSAVLRYHLATHVPEPESCAIRVADQTRHWQQGQSLVLNDYREHEAWNHGSQPRVVLFVDFKRPVPAALRPDRERVIQQFKESEFSFEIVRNFNHWLEEYGDDIATAIDSFSQPSPH